MSYLPDLEAYLADLLRNRERLAAFTDADDWAKGEAMPSDDEITRVRRLVKRVREELDDLTEEDRAQIQQAVTVVRRTRAGVVALGMPKVRQPLPDLRPEKTARSTCMIEGKRADSARRRERVIKALDAALRTGGDITVSGLARAARVDRSFLDRHRDLLERVHTAANTPVEEGRLAAVSRASLQADLANALERNTRLTARVRQLEKRLSERLGDQAWSESGLGASPDIDQLQRLVVMLEQELAEKRGELEERTEELEAARAANRELTRALDQPHSGRS
ncbi:MULTISPECIES: DUF6262 family protein [Streptomyces diastaticus group]|uniref:DUF6262 family protein n=1 Tax=Streptomyces diastaticus group TaxID=2849069 RepID=UPI0013C93040|nr:DUF6262 family protein [Streptomyces rutgersensis]GFH67494.1 hypothetical protein Srut_40080 [Streptomyces rutgersensis]